VRKGSPPRRAGQSIQWAKVSKKIIKTRSGETAVSIRREGEAFVVEAGETISRIEMIPLADGEAELRVDGRSELVRFSRDGSKIWFHYRGRAHEAEVEDPGGRRSRKHHDHSMSAPMPGVVLKIFVQPGDVVTRGMPVLILEAMKMEHTIVAPEDGTVKAVHCAVGDLVQPGADLVLLQDPVLEP